MPIRKLVSEDKIAAMVERTAKGGGELVQLMGTSAWYAPGAASAQMVDSILLDEKRVLPCTAYLEGEYGIDGLYMGVPVKLGSTGDRADLEVDLDDAEQAALEGLADAVREVVCAFSAPKNRRNRSRRRCSATVPPQWISVCAAGRRSSAELRPASGSLLRRHSPTRART